MIIAYKMLWDTMDTHIRVSGLELKDLGKIFLSLLPKMKI